LESDRNAEKKLVSELKNKLADADKALLKVIKEVAKADQDQDQDRG